MARHRTSTLWRTQNFLPDPRLIEHLVDRAGISRADVVYDLGAGTGNLTAALARHAGRVIALERDALLVRHLRRRFAGQPNVVVREADIRRYRFPHSDYRVFANPPFDITAAVIDAIVMAPAPPRDAYLVLQHEAAQRFIGRPRMALAALLIAPWFALSVMHRFQRSDFVPAPSVDAVFLRVHKRGPPLVALADATTSETSPWLCSRLGRLLSPSVRRACSVAVSAYVLSPPRVSAETCHRPKLISRRGCVSTTSSDSSRLPSNGAPTARRLGYVGNSAVCRSRIARVLRAMRSTPR